MTTPFLISDLKRDEGCRLRSYLDTKGNWTIGWGHTSSDICMGTMWTQAQADLALASDVEIACALLDAKIPWWRTLNDVRQDVLANMCFNMGWGDGVHGLSSFKNTLAKVKSGDYEGAALGMVASKWAREDVGPARSGRLADLMRHGVRP